MLLAAYIFCGIVAYLAIGIATAVAANKIELMTENSEIGDGPIKFCVALWPVAIPLISCFVIVPIVNYLTRHQRERHKAKLEKRLSYPDLEKKVKQLEKDLAEAILVKGNR